MKGGGSLGAHVIRVFIAGSTMAAVFCIMFFVSFFVLMEILIHKAKGGYRVYLMKELKKMDKERGRH